MTPAARKPDQAARCSFCRIRNRPDISIRNRAYSATVGIPGAHEPALIGYFTQLLQCPQPQELLTDLAQRRVHGVLRGRGARTFAAAAGAPSSIAMGVFRMATRSPPGATFSKLDTQSYDSE